MHWTDDRKYSTAAAVILALAVFSLAYAWGLGPVVERISEEGRRRARYEKAVVEKGLLLHKGSFWKEKQ